MPGLVEDEVVSTGTRHSDSGGWSFPSSWWDGWGPSSSETDGGDRDDWGYDVGTPDEPTASDADGDGVVDEIIVVAPVQPMPEFPFLFDLGFYLDIDLRMEQVNFEPINYCASGFPELVHANATIGAQAALAQGVLTHRMLEYFTEAGHNLGSLLGANTLHQVEFDVTLGSLGVGEHTHFIYTDASGDTFILTGSPEWGPLGDGTSGPTGQLSVQGGFLEDHNHSPNGYGDMQRIAQVDVDNAEAAWSAMLAMADQINAADLNYNFTEQNSNSVAATLAHAAGFAVADLPGGGWSAGLDNILTDEMAGGEQANARGFSRAQNPEDPVDIDPVHASGCTMTPMDWYDFFLG